jgi:hypothetical protein
MPQPENNNSQDEMQRHFSREAKRLTEMGSDAREVADALVSVGAGNLALLLGKQRTARVLFALAEILTQSAMQHGEWITTPGNLN